MRLLLLPGLDGTGELFVPFRREVGTTFAVDVQTYPKHGAQSYETLTRIVAEALPTDEPYVLVAESFSGPIACRLASTKPKGLAALVLVASFRRPPFSGLGLLAQLLPKQPPRWAVRFALLGQDAPEALVDDVRHCIGSVPRTIVAARLRAMSSERFVAKATRVTLPVLYLQAKEDRLIGAAAVADVRDHCDQFTLTTIAAPHLLLQREPRLAWHALQPFLETIRARS